MTNQLLNKLTVTRFGEKSGIFAINKPKGMTSHDVVSIFRKKLNYRKIGHAGALDPFATGLLLILVGRCTKLSDSFLNKEKTYHAKVLFGVSTDTQDIEGKITAQKSVSGSNLESKKESIIEKFGKGYEQSVSIFSSVKVDGKKLREIARKAEKFDVDKIKRLVTFHFASGQKKIVEIPKRPVIFRDFKLGNLEAINKLDLEKRYDFDVDEDLQLYTMDIFLICSKGTYVRQLAEDIGDFISMPAMLIELERTALGDITLDESISLDQVVVVE